MPMTFKEVASVIKKYNNVNLKRKPLDHESHCWSYFTGSLTSDQMYLPSMTGGD